MSGTTSLCLQQQFNNTTGEPLVGGKLYSMQAGTLNPQNAYRTAALTAGTEYANPLSLDASARVPQMFYADGLIRLILTDKNGIAQFDFDNVPVIGSSGGGGAVDTTDVTRLFSTGYMMLKYGIGFVAGYVRGNNRTIGSSTSGASELADPTAQALFQYFWNTDPLLTVLPSRGASADADWLANKQIFTPDFRGLVIGGLDGMGNIRANRLAGSIWDTLGTALDGTQNHNITVGQMPVHSHPVTEPLAGDHTHQQHENTLHDFPGSGTAVGNFNPGSVNRHGALPTGLGGGHVHGTAVGSSGGGSAIPITQPTRLVTVYFRL